MPEYNYGWSLLFWPLVVFLLLWSAFAWRPDRWHRGRGRYSQSGYPNEYDWEYSSSPTLERDNTFRGKGPRNYHRSDERILEDINERLTISSDIDASDVEAYVESGEVILNGHVHTHGEKRVAEWIVESVFGVENVKNELRVGKSVRREPHRVA